MPQSVVLMSLPGIPRTDPDWYAAFVMNQILGGGGMSSRLFTEVREKRGLAYGASSSLRNYNKASIFVASTASANERVAEAIKVAKAEIRAHPRPGRHRAGTDRRQDLSHRLAAALARFLGRSRA